MKKLFSILLLLTITLFSYAQKDSVAIGDSVIANPFAQSEVVTEITDSALKKTEVSEMPKTPFAHPHFIDEVVWVVGDEAILRSDIEMSRMQAEQEGVTFDGDPDCRIPEQLAVQKLFLHQAALDSIEVTEAEIASGVEQQINAWVQMVGSREKLEEYRKQSITEMKAALHDDFKNRELVTRMKRKLVEDIKVTPADVRTYFQKIPEDSIPFVPTTVEVEIITQQPRIPIDEINRVKDRLRDFTDRVQSGRSSFSTLARLYSEDPGSAVQGGELGYTGRGMLDPAFAAVAFNLSDPKKISKIVESEYGFHIIQLIDKRGDKINVRHILLKPKVTQADIDSTTVRMQHLSNDLKAKKFTFEEAATLLSDDKDTKNNHGLMSNNSDEGRTSRFQMKNLPTEVAKVVEILAVDSVSAPFTMVNSKGKTVVAVIKLKNCIEGHKAKISEDFQVLSNLVLAKRREQTIQDWVKKKIKNTYVRIDDRYKNCDFEYEGWIH